MNRSNGFIEREAQHQALVTSNGLGRGYKIYAFDRFEELLRFLGLERSKGRSLSGVYEDIAEAKGSSDVNATPAFVIVLTTL
jgi:hypothetical protein